MKDQIDELELRVSEMEHELGVQQMFSITSCEGLHLNDSDGNPRWAIEVSGPDGHLVLSRFCGAKTVPLAVIEGIQGPPSGKGSSKTGTLPAGVCLTLLNRDGKGVVRIASTEDGGSIRIEPATDEGAVVIDQEGVTGPVGGFDTLTVGTDDVDFNRIRLVADHDDPVIEFRQAGEDSDDEPSLKLTTGICSGPIEIRNADGELVSVATPSEQLAEPAPNGSAPAPRSRKARRRRK